MPVKPDKKSSNGVESFTFDAIGTIKSCAKYHYEAPRQGVYASTGAFLLWNDPLYAAAAADLDGFDRIWLMWVFNHNKHDSWHVKARVPVPAERDSYSVFATRSPFRPNPIGLSSVTLDGIEYHSEFGPVLYVSGADLMDGTPIYDA